MKADGWDNGLPDGVGGKHKMWLVPFDELPPEKQTKETVLIKSVLHALDMLENVYGYSRQEIKKEIDNIPMHRPKHMRN